jgi:hypothetical protein
MYYGLCFNTDQIRKKICYDVDQEPTFLPDVFIISQQQGQSKWVCIYKTVSYQSYETAGAQNF